MAKLKFITSTDSFNKLITGELETYYKVPEYQRNYCWETEHWEDLWNDLVEAKEQETAHYMGYLVFHDAQQTEEFLSETKSSKRTIIKRKDIVDGQQRLASVSLLFLAGTRLIAEHQGSPQQITRIKENYLQFYAPHDMNTPKLRIKLNKLDGEIYEKLINQITKTSFSSEERKKTGLQQIEKAYRYFYEKLKTLTKDSDDPIYEIVDFLDFTGNNLMFSVMEAEDEAEIFNLFETLNSRGLALSAVDLLKNHLIKIVNTDHRSNEDLMDIITRWNNLQDKISDDNQQDNGKHLLDFIQTYWGATGKEKQTKKLYKSFKKDIKTYEEVDDFLTKLEAVSDCYLALFNEEHYFWELYKNVKLYIKDSIVFKYKQHKSVLLAAFLNLDSTNFDTVCRCLTVCMVRYLTFCDKNPNQLETSFKALIQWLLQCKEDKSLFSREAFVNQLKNHQLYQSDEEVSISLKSRLFKQNSVPRYLFLRAFFSKEECLKYERSGLFTLEHILSKSTKAPENLTYQLGNLTLMEGLSNRKLASKQFLDKLPSLKISRFQFDAHYFKKFDKRSTWQEKEIIERTDRISKELLQCWSLQTHE